MNKIFLGFIIILYGGLSFSQTKIPSVYTNIQINDEGKYFVKDKDGEIYTAKEYNKKINLTNLTGNPTVSENGMKFNFNDKNLSGKLYYGFINYNDSKHPMPVYFKRSAEIKNGKAEINIIKTKGIYDMIAWEKNKKGTIGYRVANSEGVLLYDGIFSFKYENEKFVSTTSITEGPFVSKLTDKSVTVWFETNKPIISKVSVSGKEFSDKAACKHHEIEITELSPDKKYDYTVIYDDFLQSYSFKTAPSKGSCKPFVFAYASDCRTGQGGGERNLYGVNMYIVKKISALAMLNNVAFMQFTGDLVNGYSIDKGEMNLQYANWKRSIEPYAHYFPVIPAVGNHEFIGKTFYDKDGKRKSSVCGFPFETHSSSAVFAENFVNPTNGPKSEDGAYYDPNKSKTDFPPYDETVFHYTYGNIAVIVLNSNYLYAPSIKYNQLGEGNLHAYIMDNQMKWLEKTITKFEKDKDIDHIFVTQHTPAFPNGGHVGDDMWYGGNNKYRPVIAGKEVKKGIIERRDEYLDVLINKSTKVVALLTDDEHNYNKVKLSPDVNIYPTDYKYEKLTRNRTIWQINNGAAGAPYYAQDKRPPWTDAVSGFTTQNALVLIQVNGKKVSVRVVNPDTLELIEKYELK